MLVPVLAFVAIVASVAAVLAERARRQSARSVARWSVRANIGRALAESVWSPDTIPGVLRLLVPGYADWCVLHLVDNQQVRRAAVVHVDPVAEQRMRQVFESTPFVSDAAAGPARVIRTGQPYLIPNLGPVEQAEQPDPQLLLDAGLGSSISVPLKGRQDVLGVLTLARHTPYAYDDDDVAWTEDLAYRFALSIENGRLFAEARELFEQTVSANFVSTPEGRLLDCNRTFASLLGYESVEAVLGTPALQLYANPEERRELLAHLVARKRVVGYESMARRGDGELIPVTANAIGTFDEKGALIKISGYLVDRTEQKNLDEQLRQANRLEALSQLAGHIAHDFNNILTIIAGCVDLFPDGGSLSDGHNPLVELEEASRRAAALTQQLLAFSRRQVLQPRALDLNEVLRVAQPTLRRLSPSNVVVVLDLNPGLKRVQADRDQLDQAVVNLVVNAVDAMPGGGTLTVGTSNTELTEQDLAQYPYVIPGAYVALTVRDTGRGMDEVTRARAFEPFFTTKTLGTGTGLGLSAVYGIVKQSGGYVWLTSAPGEGTTVRICLAATGD